MLGCLCLMLLNTTPDQQIFEARIKVYGQRAGREVVMSQPTITVLMGKSARFIVGGEELVPGTMPVQREPVGVVMNLQVHGRQTDNCQVDLKLNHIVKEPSAEDTLVLRRATLHIQGKWKLNETRTLALGDVDKLKDVKVEISLREARFHGGANRVRQVAGDKELPPPVQKPN